MQLSETGKTIRYFYNQNFWKIDRVKKTVKAGWISKDEYQEITGEEYTE
ncbi:XkdX family protein [Fructobacillus fructosus]|uniref:XkdX family protein n=1 Tax=Fructobacillus fructosus TaxID=1631 RepID=A0ABM9MUB3_9LACO|nr:hypothetical protein LMG30235_GOPAMIKF_00026 [Fructobacillus fructosus]CAK1222819.1 hypothetical protein LMG30234_GAICNKDF_00026 [Fructobacillus fructosus]CAK1222949.1 hypothetical protein R54866_LGPIEIPA_00026 [Fructobacillus fructosus]CAK1240415.1 hypothetical protein R54839_PPFHFPJH_00867 [Fructobacillus fructosus]